MSTMNPSPIRFWRHLSHGFVAWQDRANARIEMNNLDDRLLRDIGLMRDNERVFSRPFWMS